MESELDPALLHSACRSPDPRERREAYRTLGTFLVRIASSRLRSKPELEAHAEECAQEALLGIWRKMEEGHGPDEPERFLGWSAAIVVHKVYDVLRRRGYVVGSGHGEVAGDAMPGGSVPAGGRTKRVADTLQQSLEDLLSKVGGAGAPDWLPDPHALDPESATFEREAFAEILVRIRTHHRLSEPSKQVLALGFLADESDEALASRLGTTRANVQVIRSRDLGRLRADDAFIAGLHEFYEA